MGVKIRQQKIAVTFIAGVNDIMFLPISVKIGFYFNPAGIRGAVGKVDLLREDAVTAGVMRIQGIFCALLNLAKNRIVCEVDDEICLLYTSPSPRD